MTDKRSLEQLLQFSTSLHSNNNDLTAAQARTGSRLDPSVIDSIMGPSDAQLMLDSMKAIASAPSSDDEVIETAFENLEALVEQIDNAKNLKNMGLWPPLIAQLDRSPVHRRGACAVIAAALQNNPEAQDAFLALEGALQRVRGLVLDSDPAVRRKALFAMTSAVRNNSKGLRKLSEVDGWRLFLSLLDNDELRKRTVFFLGNVFAQINDADLEPSEHLIQIDQDLLATLKQVRAECVPKLVKLLSLDKVVDDEDTVEKVVQALETAIKSGEIKVAGLSQVADPIRQRYGEEMCDWSLLSSS
ncbi:hsp70 nucleotide exchange factor fes1 [Savitreella phatthalungensis]